MRNRRTEMTAKTISLLLTLGFAAATACTGPPDETAGPSDETAGPADEAAAPEMSDSTGGAPGQDAAPSAEAGSRIAQIAYIKASNTGFGDNFGAGSSAIGDDAVSLSADGMTLAVGAPFESSGSAGIDGDQSDDSVFGAGAVYVFVPQGDTWAQQAYIKASNPGITDNFGFATALSADGNTLAVSAHFEAGGDTGVNADQDDDSIPQAGAVYIFERTDTTWDQQAYIKASNTGHIGERLDPDEQPELAGEHFGPIASGEYSYADSYGEMFDDGDQFGSAIALSDDGNVLVATATAEDSGTPDVNSDQTDNSKRSAGAAYVFRREGTTWNQTAYIKPSNPEVDALFGYSVALSADGRRVAVGAYDEDGSPASTNEFQDGLVRGTGAVYVFDFDGETWHQTGYLKAFNAERGDSLGVAVVISDDGRTVIATAQDEDGLSTGINNIPGPDYQDDIRPTTGAVYAFVEQDGAWSQQAYIKASNTGSGDVFGSRLAVSGDGNVLLVGAQLEDSASRGIDGFQDDDSALEAGAVYLFTRTGDTWAQEAYVKGSNTEIFDEFGSSVSISADGSVFAVGAYYEDSATTGVGGDQNDNSMLEAGAVYLFSR